MNCNMMIQGTIGFWVLGTVMSVISVKYYSVLTFLGTQDFHDTDWNSPLAGQAKYQP